MKNRECEINDALRKYGFGKLLNITTKEKILSTTGEEYDLLSNPELPVNLRLMFQELGAGFILLGQFLSSRPDMVGDAIAGEFEKLQDDNNPVTYEQVKAIVEGELDGSIDELFAEFSEESVDASSIAQIHQAELISGEKVAVKVQKEGVTNLLDRDITILKDLVSKIHKYDDQLRKYNLPGIIDLFDHTIHLDFDFTNEVMNMKYRAAKYSNDESKHIPIAYSDYCTSKVLTMEFVEPTPSNEVLESDNEELDKDSISTPDETSQYNSDEISNNNNLKRLEDNALTDSQKGSTNIISDDDKKIDTTGIDLVITLGEDSNSLKVSVDSENLKYSDYETTAFEYSDLDLNIIPCRKPQTINLKSSMSHLDITDFNKYNLNLTGLDFSLLPSADLSSLDVSILMSTLKYSEFGTRCFDFSDLDLSIKPGLDSSSLYITVSLPSLRIINYGIEELNLSNLDLKIDIPDINSKDFEISIAMSSLNYTDFKEKYLDMKDVDVKLSPMKEESDLKSYALISDVLFCGLESDEYNVPDFNISGINFKDFKVSGFNFAGIDIPDFISRFDLSFLNLSDILDLMDLGFNGQTYRIPLDSIVLNLANINLLDFDASALDFSDFYNSDTGIETFGKSTLNLTGFNFSQDDVSSLNLTDVDLSNVDLATLMDNIEMSNLNSAILNATGMNLSDLDLSRLELSNLIIELNFGNMDFAGILKEFGFSSFNLTNILELFNLTEVTSIILRILS